MRKKIIIITATAFILCVWTVAAEAARQFTVAQTNPAPTPEFDMGTTQSVTFRVANTSNGTNAAETITQVRFRLNGTYTTFSNTTAAPAGWTLSAFSTTSVTFAANTAGDRIPSSGTNYKDFTLALIMATSSQDRSDLLRDVRARFSTGNNVTINNQGAWTLRSLSITSFTITDCAGAPIASLVAGSNFCLVMTVRNISSAVQNNIVSNPNPPTVTASAGITNATKNQSPTTTYSPSPLNLAVSASGTITFRYTTGATDDGTIFFTANARNGATVTSRSAVSPVLDIGKFSASLGTAPACQYNGQNITVTMTLANGFGYNIINVTPTLTPAVGAPIVYVSGPAPGAPNGPVPANGGTFVFTWVYRVSGGIPGDIINFTGSAQGTGQTGGNPLRTTSVTAAPPVTRGGFTVAVNPASTYAGSSQEELAWTVTNLGCANINQAAIVLPGGWTFSGDSYSLVTNTVLSQVETWTVAGTTFTAPNAVDRMPYNNSGGFSLVFSGTPAAAGVAVFNVTVTDANGQAETTATNIAVNAYNSAVPGQGNYTGTGVWREEIK